MKMHATLSPIDSTARAVDALLTALDSAPAIGAATAYKSAIRRHGANLVASLGPAALDQVLARIRADAPDKAAAEDRVWLVSLAWERIAHMEGAAALN